MNRRIWLGIGAIVLLLGGWLGFRAFHSNSPLSVLVPSDALLVLESTHLLDSTTAQIQRQSLTLNQIPLFEQAVAHLSRNLLASGDTTRLRQFLRNRPVRCSLHPVSKSTLDFIFYIPVSTEADRVVVSQILSPDPNRFRLLTRPFNGERVSELVSLRNESYGHFLQTDDALICSGSGVLIENVARRMHSPNLLTDSEELTTGEGQLAGLSVRPEVLQRLFGEGNTSLVRLFLPEHLTLRFRNTDSRTHLVGYASDQIGQRADVAALFQNQAPRRILAGQLIPQNTSSVYHISLSDGAAFGKSIRALLASNSDDRLQDRLERIAPETDNFYGAIGSDVLLCRLESPDARTRQVLVVQGRDGAALARAYQQIAYRLGAATPAPLKTFLGHKTLLLNVAELPATLFTSLFAGFRESWVTQHGSALIVANSEDVMQEYLKQITQKTVWAADERQSSLLAQTLRPANFTAFVRLNRSSESVPERWPAPWRKLLGRPFAGFDNLENMVYQASYGNEKILSTLILGRTTRRASGAVLNKVLLRRKVEFNASLIAAPVVVGSLADGSAQFYAQNRASQFVLVTPEGDKIVQDTTDGPIRSNVIATDFLDNGRLQYLFMTDRRLYVAQPGNQSVKLQVIRLPAGLNPTLLAQPRGSRQRSIVALAAHTDGHIYALDRQKRQFVRLMTAQTKGPLQLPFQVIDTPTGMEVLAMQGNGILNRWRDDGTPVTHFPAKLDLSFVSPALQPANADYMQAITEQGELLRLNPNGLIASRNGLYRPVRAGSFRLFPDVSQQTWLLMRTSDTEAAILDQQGNERFAVRGLQPDQTSIRYHRLGGGIELISLKSGSFTTLYTLDGKRIGDRPIPSDFPVALQFDELTNELYVLSGIQKAVQLFSIRLR
ncbi:hypothetical protein F5984_12080 [Rudanella paleaurantiibacter]|uniref:DUF3352 domain-containing protein n=1 Tax=Rudanella paleaurantiibacter TaxID=2614655 RepID=A0A7J5TZM8_9BACT|nr:hypothetical protein [Rudanella paleaurantiibacter]KAB7730874.1 hypothetical protein F5984_12080 [Rudanella paleaurantiibacter]